MRVVVSLYAESKWKGYTGNLTSLEFPPPAPSNGYKTWLPEEAVSKPIIIGGK